MEANKAKKKGAGQTTKHKRFTSKRCKRPKTTLTSILAAVNMRSLRMMDASKWHVGGILCPKILSRLCTFVTRTMCHTPLSKDGKMKPSRPNPSYLSTRDHLARHSVIEEAITDSLSKEKGGNCSRSFASIKKVTNVHSNFYINKTEAWTLFFWM